MANIELVIKIPEEAYKLLQNKGVDWLGAEHILNAVANGTPLPKGHGRLIDADDLIQKLLVVSSRPVKSQLYILREAPTIIKADYIIIPKSEDKNDMG